MSSDFEQFARAISERTAARSTSNSQLADQHASNISAQTLSVTVLGANADGCLLSALVLAQGAAVTLFSAYGAQLAQIRQAGGITLRGDGPFGTFHVDSASSPSIQTTAELDRAVASADVIFLTGPVHKQRTYAMVLADHLSDGQTLVVTPARSFAALETAWALTTGGCSAEVSIIELQRLPYWIQNAHNNSTESQLTHLTLSACSNNVAATLPSNDATRLARLQALLPDITALPSVLESSFTDASGIVESVALLMGVSLIGNGDNALPPGAVPLQARNTFRSLIDNAASHRMLQALINERRNVAHRFGVRSMPDDDILIEANAGSIVDAGSRDIPSADSVNGILRCAAIGSLVPLQSAARLAKVDTPATDAIITMISLALGADLESAGRKIEAMGVRAQDLDSARRQIDAIAHRHVDVTTGRFENSAHSLVRGAS